MLLPQLSVAPRAALLTAAEAAARTGDSIVMRSLGLDPKDTTTDITQPSGVGNVAAQAVLEFRQRTVPISWAPFRRCAWRRLLGLHRLPAVERAGGSCAWLRSSGSSRSELM